MADNNGIVKYTDIGTILDEWINDIAPKYFNFDNTNNYKAGGFGYINEVISNVAEDTFNAVSIARREFYPTTAQYQKTLYKMAALQQLDIPLASPAQVRAILLIEEKEIISRGTRNGDLINYTIDDNMTIMADNLNFMIDYPISIIAKKIGGRWSYITHYDINKTNSLNMSNRKYIQNKVLVRPGENLLLMDVILHQVRLQSISQTVTKNANIDVVTMDFPVDGQLANFEVFYREDDSKNDIQLKKLVLNSNVPTTPFCMYSMVDNNKLRLHFPSNIYFTPRFNSSLTVNIYTTDGEAGNFDSFEGSLACSPMSEKYTYNSSALITGKTVGSSYGGEDIADFDKFKRKILYAYATNNTITTESDLQKMFDDRMQDTNSRILFFKKRDDTFERLYGAFLLVKDADKNVIPTNTLPIKLKESQFDVFYETTDRLILKPGKIYQYDATEPTMLVENPNLNLIDNLDPYDANNTFLYTTPFLISVTKTPNAVGFYLNSINEIIPMGYSYVNDNSFFQFLINNLHVSRNAIIGENFYKFSITISPSTSDANLQFELIEDYDAEDEANYFHAAKDGIIYSLKYENDGVYATLKYSDDSTAKIRVNPTVTKAADGTYVYDAGWDVHFKVGEAFLYNDIVATKKYKDSGMLRMIGVAEGAFDSNEYYFPYVLENYDSENDYYTFSAYLGTDDYLSMNGYVRMTSGVVTKSGEPVVGGALINFEKTRIASYTFYHYEDKNYPHQFSQYPFVANYTMTNGYTQNESESFDLVMPVRFIRSTVIMEESGNPADTDLRYTLKEIPLVKSNWIKNYSNCNYIVDKILNNYQFIIDVYELLENNFTIDMKFFNTYGYSKYYKIGIKDNMNTLDHVNCSFKFGIKLSTLSSYETFKNKFITYVKEYIESLNDASSDGKSIYIMNMISDIKTKFEEISYIEYYGMNEYDHGIQKIEAMNKDEISDLGYASYVPEFINIYSLTDVDGTNTPQILITLLE